MTWSPQQEKAIDAVGRWLAEKRSPVFMLAGFAGTGKTTLAKHLAASVGGTVCFAAFTGKAALVLRKSGCLNVSTIHKLIYRRVHKGTGPLVALENELVELRKAKPQQQQRVKILEKELEKLKSSAAAPSFILNPDSELVGASLIVIDEYSMIDEQMGHDLLSFRVPVLALGDPGQLPPVFGQPFFTRQPDVLLTEIHRQAADNPIIRMAAGVRQGFSLAPGQFGESTVMNVRDIERSALAQKILSCDQLLVGRNETRASSNARVREHLGRSSTYPVSGDKLVCLRNNHLLGLLNGQQWVTTRDASEDDDYLSLGIVNEEGGAMEVSAHREYFQGNKPDHFSVTDAESFDYGYALTVHKAQGSQWPSVVLFDEWRGRDRSRWLYTAITRASERIDIVQL